MPPTDEVDGGAPDLPNQNAMDIYIYTERLLSIYILVYQLISIKKNLNRVSPATFVNKVLM